MYLKAKKENSLDMLWQQWLVDFSRMDGDNFISFKDYKQRTFKPETEELDTKKILEEAEKIKSLDQKGVE